MIDTNMSAFIGNRCCQPLPARVILLGLVDLNCWSTLLLLVTKAVISYRVFIILALHSCPSESKDLASLHELELIAEGSKVVLNIFCCLCK